jgi:hypothetical protein
MFIVLVKKIRNYKKKKKKIGKEGLQKWGRDKRKTRPQTWKRKLEESQCIECGAPYPVY